MLVLLKLAVTGHASVRACSKVRLGLSKSMIAVSIDRLREAKLLKEDDAGGLRINRLARVRRLSRARRTLDRTCGKLATSSSDSDRAQLRNARAQVVRQSRSGRYPSASRPNSRSRRSPLHPRAPFAAQKILNCSACLQSWTPSELVAHETERWRERSSNASRGDPSSRYSGCARRVRQAIFVRCCALAQ